MARFPADAGAMQSRPPLARFATGMSKLRPMPHIKLLVQDEWRVLRDVRLAALRESPSCFLAMYENEKVFDKLKWRAEFSRGDWTVSMHDKQLAGIVGCTREASTRLMSAIWNTCG